MNEMYTVVQSRVETDGRITYLVTGPGGVIEVTDDGEGEPAARLRSGYLLAEVGEEEVLLEARRAVKASGIQAGRFAAGGE